MGHRGAPADPAVRPGGCLGQDVLAGRAAALSCQTARRRGRAAECSGFENRRAARHRGFESSRLRHSHPTVGPRGPRQGRRESGRRGPQGEVTRPAGAGLPVVRHPIRRTGLRDLGGSGGPVRPPGRSCSLDTARHGSPVGSVRFNTSARRPCSSFSAPGPLPRSNLSARTPQPDIGLTFQARPGRARPPTPPARRGRIAAGHRGPKARGPGGGSIAEFSAGAGSRCRRTRSRPAPAPPSSPRRGRDQNHQRAPRIAFVPGPFEPDPCTR